MRTFLARLGTRQFVPLWLFLILAAAVILIWFAIHYRDRGKWWLRTNVALFAFIVLPAALIGLSDVFGRFFDWLGFPGPLVWLFGMAGGELVTMGDYLLAAVSALLGIGTIANKGASQHAKIAAIAASFISWLFIALYMYVASRPQHW